MAEGRKTGGRLLTVCAVCKKLLQDGEWKAGGELRLADDEKVTHAICPDCGKKLYPRYAEPLPTE